MWRPVPTICILTAETIANGATLSKCAPPIRGRENRERLWQGLRDGTIDQVVTDHSPCPPAMKRIAEGNFQTAWGGIASLSIALPLMWTEASRRGFTLLDSRAGWRLNRLDWLDATRAKVGSPRDTMRISLSSIPIVNSSLAKDRLHYRHPLSPYLGETLRGVVKATYLRGKAVFDEGEFPGEPGGRECSANTSRR